MSIAPPRELEGIITDQEGNLLPDVHMYYVDSKGKKIGVISNFEGQFYLNHVPANAVVKFSYQGLDVAKFFTYQVPEKVVLDITNLLDEVNLTSTKKDYSFFMMISAVALSKILAPKQRGLKQPFIKEATL